MNKILVLLALAICVAIAQGRSYSQCRLRCSKMASCTAMTPQCLRAKPNCFARCNLLVNNTPSTVSVAEKNSAASPRSH